MLNGLTAFRAQGEWFKGNLHTHAITAKDTFDWSGAVERFASLGHDFLAVTDHDKHLLSQDNRARLYDFARQERRLVLLPGAELHPPRETSRVPRCYHLVAPWLPEEVSIERTTVSLAQALEELKSTDAPFFVAHPHWAGNDLGEMLSVTPPALGIEVFNTLCSLDGRGFSCQLWDGVLDRGIPVMGIAADDWHKSMPAGRGWIVAKALERRAPAIMKAIIDGSFYATTGPAIKDLTFDADVLSIITAPVKTINFVGPPRTGRSVTAEPGETICEAMWNVPDAFNGHVRVECYADHQRMAWSNPVFFQDGRPVE